tara:strand:- start:4559 stop:4786 length:228 start_codon:yes stop_codon:yes gene_type:complete
MNEQEHEHKHIQILSDEIRDVLGGLNAAQQKALDEAHEIYHKRASGPLPWEVQVAIVSIAKSQGKAPVKKKVATK